jgi:hypothetical protein
MTDVRYKDLKSKFRRVVDLVELDVEQEGSLLVRKVVIGAKDEYSGQ